MADVGVCGGVCVGLCIGGGCASQIGLLIWHLWREPQDGRKKRRRGTRRHALAKDRRGRSADQSGDVVARVAVIPRKVEKQLDKQSVRKTSLLKESPSKRRTRKESPRKQSPRKQSPRREQLLTINDGSRPPKQSPNREHERATNVGVTNGGRDGFSIEDAQNFAKAANADTMLKSPGDVLSEMQRGNTRFWMGTAQRPEKSAFERRALLTKQFPAVAVLSCSDSRVPVEIVFDMGLGDMFVVRVAGNCLDNASMGSLQFAVHHLKVKVLVIMGHEGCGAVKVAGLPAKDIDREPKSLGHLLHTLSKGIDHERLSNIHDSRARDREAVVSNVSTQLGHITQDPGIMGKIRAKELIAVGAFYELSSGIVDFFHEVSGDVPSTVSRGSFTSSLVSDAAKRGNTVNGSLVRRSVSTPSQNPMDRMNVVQRMLSVQVAAPIRKPTAGVKVIDPLHKVKSVIGG